MKLLITNTQEDQAYLILLCLKDEASKVVVTICGDTLLERWAGMSPWSRHVHARYRVPDFYADWKAALVQAHNTPAEERYIQRIEAICAAEEIDTVFPSFDPEVYVFSKNKARLAERGIVAVVPDFDGLPRLLDKSLTIEAAQRVGFPTPASRVVRSLEALAMATHDIEGPWVLKPRCNAHGANIVPVEDPTRLESAFRDMQAIQEGPMLQECVQAKTKRNYYLIANRELELVSLFSPTVSRTRKTGFRTPCAAVVSCAEVPYLEEVRALIRELGVWGAMTLQTVVDATDGKPKLMEINPRFGHNLWYRTALGVNEPLILLRIARGEHPGDVPPFRENVILLDPFWDVLHLLGQSLDQGTAWFRSKIHGTADGRDPSVQESIPLLLRRYKEEYFTERDRKLSPLSGGFFSDPFPPLVRMVRVIAGAIQRRAS